MVDVEDWRRGNSFAAGHPTSFLASGDASLWALALAPCT